MQIKDHQLVDVRFEQTQNYWSGPFKTSTGLPDAVIIHYTAMTDMEAAVKSLKTKKPQGNASAHLVIGKKGEVVQLARFDQRTWHAGVSAYGGRESYNHYSIGIEIDNAGWLNDFGNSKYSRKLLAKQNIYFPEDQVFKGRHKNPSIPYQFWEEYTEEQVDTVMAICQVLYDTYNIKEFLGHDEISPGRKQDPGPAFPMEEIRGQFTADRSGNLSVGVVNTNLLNIRGGAGTGYPKIAQPLTLNKEVEIIEEKEGWVKVRTEIEGWVSKKYVTPK